MNKHHNHSFFHFKNLKIFLHPEVYEPAEDTFILIESIQTQPKKRILEIGAGTGIISLYYAKKGADVICTDINPYAVRIIKKNIQANNDQITGSIDVRKGYLFEPIQQHETFDTIIFNPPYLPTTTEQKKGISEYYAQSFDGGPTGLSTTTQFLRNLSPYLPSKGTGYFISSSYSNIKKLYQLIDTLNMDHEITQTLRCDDELLRVHKIIKK